MWIVAYQAMRALRWMLSIGFVGFCFHYLLEHAPHLDQFGNLSNTELIVFGLPLGGVVAGLFELMVRDRAYPEQLP